MARPNILFLLSDEHSFRFFSHLDRANGGEPVDTPNLDRLAAQAATFSNAYCQMPLCSPSRLCLLSGREVRGARAWDNESILDPDLITLPAVLRGAGYSTCLSVDAHDAATDDDDLRVRLNDDLLSVARSRTITRKCVDLIAPIARRPDSRDPLVARRSLI